MNTYFSKAKPSHFTVPRDIKFPAAEKLLRITKPWLFLKVFEGENFSSRLPEHYKHFYWSWKHGEKTPVHYDAERGNFKLAENKETAVPVKNVGVQVVYPSNVNEGLWGGEGIIKGYKHLGRYKGELAKYWHPTLFVSTLYSEILDRYMDIVVTDRTLRLIDEHYGLDYYLLENTYADVYSTLGFKLKREMLLALGEQTLYPDDPGMRKEVTGKYKRFMIPVEEANWLGLSLEEACMKQQRLEEATYNPVPLKHQFRDQLLQYLKEHPPSEKGVTLPTGPAAVADHQHLTKSKESSSWLSKINPFGKST